MWFGMGNFSVDLGLVWAWLCNVGGGVCTEGGAEVVEAIASDRLSLSPGLSQILMRPFKGCTWKSFGFRVYRQGLEFEVWIAPSYITRSSRPFIYVLCQIYIIYISPITAPLLASLVAQLLAAARTSCNSRPAPAPPGKQQQLQQQRHPSLQNQLDIYRASMGPRV